MRSGDVTNHNDIIVSLTKRDSILFWGECVAKEFIKDPDRWCEVERTICLPINLTSKGDVFINIMAHNADAKSYFDVDDLKIEIKN